MIHSLSLPHVGNDLLQTIQVVSLDPHHRLNALLFSALLSALSFSFSFSFSSLCSFLPLSFTSPAMALVIPGFWVVCLGLNYLGCRRACVVSTVIGSNLLTLGFTLVHGKETQCQMNFLSLALLSLLVSEGSPLSLGLTYSISAGCFLLVQFDLLLSEPVIKIAPEVLANVARWNSVSTVGTLGLLVAFLGLQQHVGTRSSERIKKESLRLLATMSHEVRTPLSSIMGLTELMLGQEMKTHQRYLLHMVHSAEESLLYIVNNILDFTKMEANKLALESTEEFDIVDFIEDTLAIFTAFAQKKGVELTTEFDPVLLTSSPVLLGDVKRLRQILWNLISNAVKFTHEGRVFVKVSVVSQPKVARPAKERTPSMPQVTLLFEVADTGVGIDEATQKVLFSEFTQAAGFSKSYGGTGLGLSICKRLVELMNSRISLRSQVGKGSSFSFPLTFQAVPTPDAPEVPIEAKRPRRVLLVSGTEDSKLFQSLKLVLECWNHDCGQVTFRQATAMVQEEADAPLNADLVFVEFSSGTHEEAVAFAKLCNARDLHHKLVAAIPFTFEPPQDETLFRDFITIPTKTSHLKNLLSNLFSSEPPTSVKAPQGTPPPSEVVESQLMMASLDENKSSRRSSAEEAQSSGEINNEDVTVLLAEDNVVNQLAVSELLRSLGVKCDVVGDGHEAVKAFMNGSYDLVLMDQEMPNLDGVQATKQIRAHHLHHPGGKRVPIVALTGNVSLEDREACLQAGMDDFLTKPVRLRELTHLVKRMTLG